MDFSSKELTLVHAALTDRLGRLDEGDGERDVTVHIIGRVAGAMAGVPEHPPAKAHQDPLRYIAYALAALIVILAADAGIVGAKCTNPVARVLFDINQGGFYCGIKAGDVEVPL